MSDLRYNFTNRSSGRPYYRGDEKLSRTDDNAFVVMDGSKLVFASEGERFSHIKHDWRIPLISMNIYQQNCSRLNLGIADDISVYWKAGDHHLSHIYEAFYQSGFKESAVLVNDGYGTLDECLTLAYITEGTEPIILKKFPKALSPSWIYGQVAQMIFGKPHSEGKLMGLAGYGKSNGRTYISWNLEGRGIEISKDAIRNDFNECKNSKAWADEGVMAARDIAFEIQKNYEEVIIEVVKLFCELLHEAGIETENLCMSGGGILNCPTNSRIVDLDLFKHYYASPQPGDGCAEAVGKCLRALEKTGKEVKSQRLRSAYLGMKYLRGELIAPSKKMSSPFNDMIAHLESRGVIAWYQGRAEYGPRALGHRSFLADPQDIEMLDSLNKIKGREGWRPLAPVVPESLFCRIFEVENTDMCEFMLRTLKIKDGWRKKLGAVCHVDGTTRPQLLRRDVNPQLHDLLMAYFEKTHIPCLINTSLNINGFPIVETPRDLCDLREEVSYMENVPSLMAVFVDDKDFYEVGVEDGGNWNAGWSRFEG